MLSTSAFRRVALLATVLAGLAVLPLPATAQQVLSHSEGVNRGALFDVFFERPVSCITRITDGPGGGAVNINLDCRNRPLGTTVLFDLFGGMSLNPAWTVTGSSVSTGQVVRTPSGSSPRIAVRLQTEPGTQRTATVSVTVGPAAVPAQPLPNCAAALAQRPRDFVCHSDADCPPTIAAVPGRPPPPPALVCSVPCGNRCMPK